MAEFTEDQLDKRVVAQDGSVVGEVTGVRDGSLLVSVGPDADRDVLDELNWDGVVDQEAHDLNDRYVSRVGDDVIRLRV